MAANPPKNEPKTHNTRVGMYVKHNTHTEKFMDVKIDGTPFKKERREKAMDVIKKLKDR
jgi:hypothetical protein